MNIKNYYLKAFPSDNLGEEINANATFDGLLENITEPYSDIYNLWIS